MPQGQPQGGKLLAVQQLPWSLVWCGARGASWPAMLGRAASLAKEGDGCCVGLGVSQAWAGSPCA